MNDLVEFYRARLGEDEQAACRAGETFRQIGETGVIVATEGDRAEECASANWTGIAEHIVRHDPARVLREVEAKRRILDAYEAQLAERARIGVLRDAEMAKGDELALEVAELTGKGIALNGWIQHLEWVVRVHVAAHADHPDYREEWRP